MTDRAAFPHDVLRLTARSHRELVCSARGGASVFVDIAEWPPQVCTIPGSAQAAARSPSGRWLTYTTTYLPDRVELCALQTWASIRDATQIASEPDPIAKRDLAPLLRELDDSDSIEYEQSRAEQIESVHFCGERALIVPRHVGLGDRRHPLLRGDAGWTPLTALPPFTKTKVSEKCPAHGLRLDDGTDVLIWDGHVFAYAGGEFERFVDDRLVLHWFRDWEPMPAPGGEFYVIADNALLAVGRGRVRRLLPGRWVARVCAGPGELLAVRGDGFDMLFDPVENRVARLPDTICGTRREVLGGTRDGALVVLHHKDRAFVQTSPEALAALPWEPAGTPPKRVVVPVPALTATNLSSSRPRIAADNVFRSQVTAIADGARLRFHDSDEVAGVTELATELVGVVYAVDQLGALDTSGVLHVLDLPGRPPARSRMIAPEPRSLAATDGMFIVLAKQRPFLYSVHAGVRSIDFEAPIAAAADPDGTIVFAGDDKRLAVWSSGTLLDLPHSAEQIVALAPLGEKRFACLGQLHLYLLDLRHGELESLEHPVAAPHLAASPSGRRIAWCGRPGIVALAEVRDRTAKVIDVVRYTSKYTAPADTPLSVTGLAFLDDDRLLIGLDAGRGNIIDLAAKTTAKLDPHPGDVPSSWLIMYGGQLLT